MLDLFLTNLFLFGQLPVPDITSQRHHPVVESQALVAVALGDAAQALTPLMACSSFRRRRAWVRLSARCAAVKVVGRPAGGWPQVVGKCDLCTKLLTMAKFGA